MHQGPMQKAYRLLTAALAAVSFAPACARSSAATDSAAGRAPAEPANAAPGAAETTAPDEEVRPIYPLGDASVDPRAERLCRALHDLPASRKAACCATHPAASPAQECARNVTAALKLGGVSLAEADLDRCVHASERAFEGCGWVSPLSPAAPAECQAIFHGVFQVGQPCRSTLECAEGLHCAGVGPTDPGACAPAGGDGAACSRSVDALAAYARQDAIEAKHPACNGFCRMGRCQAFVAPGGACLSNVECRAGSQCVGRTCQPGSAAAKRGEACGGDRACEGALVCRGGSCAPRGGEGEECAMPWDCAGACVRAPGEAKGKCASPCKG